MKKSAREQSPPPSGDHNSTDSVAASDSDHDQDPHVSFHPAVSPNQVPTMFMPYIEGPKMNWMVNDGLYHRFLKWHLKCETILDCKLANLPTKQKCQKVIVWSSDFGMDLYVSWNISKEDLTLDAIWTKFEEFSKPQTNEVRAHFNLLTSFWQGEQECGWMVQCCSGPSQPSEISTRNRQKFSIMTSSGFSWEMKISSPKQLMRAIMIYRNFQLVKCTN